MSFEVVFWLAPVVKEPGTRGPALRTTRLADEVRVDGSEVFSTKFYERHGLAHNPELPDVHVVRVGSHADLIDLLERGEYERHRDSRILKCYGAPRRTPAPRTTQQRSPQAMPTFDQWGLTRVGGSTIEAVDSSGIEVGVVDTGVDKKHPDLVDAVTFVNTTQEAELDDNGHGTHVAGIIAGRGAAPNGMVGVSNVKLLCIKGLAENYDARAYYQALQLAVARTRVINLSLSGEGEDPTETLILGLAKKNGVPVICAAGNLGEQGDPDPRMYPASLDSVISVGATDRTDSVPDWCSSGSTIAAPGVDIWSTWPTHKGKSYEVLTGTSMAAPMVTGTVAAMLAVNAQCALDFAVFPTTPLNIVNPRESVTRAKGP